MDIDRISRASDAIIGGEGLEDRLRVAVRELVTLQGTAESGVEDAIKPLIEDGQEALDSGDHDVQFNVAKRIVRYCEDLRGS